MYINVVQTACAITGFAIKLVFCMCMFVRMRFLIYCPKECEECQVETSQDFIANKKSGVPCGELRSSNITSQ